MLFVYTWWWSCFFFGQARFEGWISLGLGRGEGMLQWCLRCLIHLWTIRLINFQGFFRCFPCTHCTLSLDFDTSCVESCYLLHSFLGYVSESQCFEWDFDFIAWLSWDSLIEDDINSLSYHCPSLIAEFLSRSANCYFSMKLSLIFSLLAMFTGLISLIVSLLNIAIFIFVSFSLGFSAICWCLNIVLLSISLTITFALPLS